VKAAWRRPRGGIRVSYGVKRLGSHGGAIKFRELERFFPHTWRDYTVLYLGSSTVPAGADGLISRARRRGATFVWNQNGVAYPGWHGPGWERTNAPKARALHAADHVFFQSEFCRLSSDRFLGERTGAWEVLHNPVDTERFAPVARPRDGLTLLLGGNQYQRYRLETALEVLALLPEARLLVTGALSWHADRRRSAAEARELIAALALGGRVELTGTYTQADAPRLLRRADILLHTKYNDPCPTIVLEAMACGLPVVFSASGGVPELVDDGAGIGVPAPLDWEADHPPQPESLADAVREIAERLDEHTAAARERALRFDLRPWVERHREVFAELVR
jgi:glycosyltransferase involved in cell wall biosynthesis